MFLWMVPETTLRETCRNQIDSRNGPMFPSMVLLAVISNTLPTYNATNSHQTPTSSGHTWESLSSLVTLRPVSHWISIRVQFGQYFICSQYDVPHCSTVRLIGKHKVGSISKKSKPSTCCKTHYIDSILILNVNFSWSTVRLKTESYTWWTTQKRKGKSKKLIVYSR